jgi:transposase
MPEGFGLWLTACQRFRDWHNRGVFGQMLKRLHIRFDEQGLINLKTRMIDSATVRANRTSAGAGKK